MGRRDRGRLGGTILSAAMIAAACGLSACRDASWSAPPRYDGAGYAVLARALLEGQGYRAIDHPDRPRHAHFPPGYPLLLAAVWRIAGISTTAARAVSVGCTVGATLAAWWWFRRMMPAGAALLLGLALAINWQWARTGGSIQSEPLYMLLGQLTILAAARGMPAPALGALLAGCFLTRHVAVGLAAAVLIDLALRRGWRPAMIAAATCALLVSPWLAWMVSAGHNQAGLALGGDDSWAGRIVGQFAFYMQRLPDQITGPFLEVAAVFRPFSITFEVAHFWMWIAYGILVFGWFWALRRPRRRLAGLVPIATMIVLLAWPFTEAGRFLIPLIPCILVGAVEGLAGCGYVRQAIKWSTRRFHRRRPPRRRTIAAAIVLAATLPYSAYALIRDKARAAEVSQRDFDAACSWIAGRPDHPGPVVSRHPGEVFWQTGRPGLEVASTERPGDHDADPLAIARTIAKYRVAFLLIDQHRYANAPQSPLARFVDQFPNRARKVWSRQDEGSAIDIYEILPGNSALQNPQAMQSGIPD